MRMVKCDRCGKLEPQSDNTFGKLRLYDSVNGEQYSDEYHYCHDCFKTIHWLVRERVNGRD